MGLCFRKGPVMTSPWGTSRQLPLFSQSSPPAAKAHGLATPDMLLSCEQGFALARSADQKDTGMRICLQVQSGWSQIELDFSTTASSCIPTNGRTMLKSYGSHKLKDCWSMNRSSSRSVRVSCEGLSSATVCPMPLAVDQAAEHPALFRLLQ